MNPILGGHEENALYISGIKTPCDWAEMLVAQHAPEGWDIHIYLPKRGKKRTGVYGHASWPRKLIEVRLSTTDDTDMNVWIVLHEIAHAIHRASPTWKDPPITPSGRRQRGSVHPPEFWDIAITLFEKHGVMNTALNNEYMVGRKRIRGHLRYKEHMQNAESLVDLLYTPNSIY